MQQTLTLHQKPGGRQRAKARLGEGERLLRRIRKLIDEVEAGRAGDLIPVSLLLGCKDDLLKRREDLLAARTGLRDSISRQIHQKQAVRAYGAAAITSPAPLGRSHRKTAVKSKKRRKT